MYKILKALMQHLNQITVQGESVEHLASARHLVRILLSACEKAQTPPSPQGKELSQNE